LDPIEKEYRDAINELGPVMKRIEMTDRLIDQIVYRLYGLKEEEINIVERSLRGFLAFRDVTQEEGGIY